MLARFVAVRLQHSVQIRVYPMQKLVRRLALSQREGLCDEGLSNELCEVGQHDAGIYVVSGLLEDEGCFLVHVDGCLETFICRETACGRSSATWIVVETTVETPIGRSVGNEVPLQISSHLIEDARVVWRVGGQQRQCQQQQRVRGVLHQTRLVRPRWTFDEILQTRRQLLQGCVDGEGGIGCRGVLVEVKDHLTHKERVLRFFVGNLAKETTESQEGVQVLQEAPELATLVLPLIHDNQQHAEEKELL